MIATPLGRSIAYWQGRIGATPALDAIDPLGGATGTVVSLTGSNLDGTSSVRFNGLAAAFTVASASLVRATVPPNARSGPVELDTPFGTARGSGSFVAAPIIESFLPTQAPAGAEVAIVGINFSNATSVKFGGVDAQYHIVSDTLLRAIVPAAAPDGPIAAANPGGAGTSGAPFRLGPTLGVLDLAWDDCGLAGSETKNFACDRNAGEPFSLVGSFAPPVGVDRLMGLDADIGVYATTLPDWWKHGIGQCRGTIGLSTTFDFTSDAGSCADFWAGRGSGATTYALDYYGPNTARIHIHAGMFGTAAVDPRTHYDAFKVNIFPTSSVGGCNGCDTPVRLILQQIQLLQTASAGYDPVISTPYHRNAALWQGAPGPLPQVSSFTPRAGPIGTGVDIQGAHFTGATGVRFGIEPASSFEVRSDALIHATVPAGARTGPIQIKTPYGTSASDSVFIVPPVVQSFAPGQAPFGYPIVIQGYNFTAATAVRFSGKPAVFTVTSDTRIVAKVPDGASDGPLTVVNPAGSATSEGTFHVGAVPLDPPAITSIAPPGGVAGAVVSIGGLHFTGTTSVRFGALEASFTENSDMNLAAVVPAGARTARIRVTTPGGSTASDSVFIVAPIIQSFAPAEVEIGQTVSILGLNFTRVTGVTFGDAVAAFAVVSDTLIHALVPAAAPADGRIFVANIGGVATSDPFHLKPQAPGGLNLAWDDCGAAGDQDQTFACDANAGGRFTLVASFVAPSHVTQFLGASAELRFESKTDVLPDWWRFGAGQCRGSGLNVDFNFTDGPFTCTDWTAGRAVGGYLFQIGVDALNRARLLAQYAVPIDAAGPLVSGTEYYAFKVRIARSLSTGAGSCAGCSVPVNITFRELQLFQPPELHYDPDITTPALNNKARWQPSHEGPNLVSDPSFESSIRGWGPVGGAALAQVAQPHDGAFALQVVGPDSAGEFGINDTPNLVPVTPAAARTYRFRAWVKAPAPGLRLQLREREYWNRVRVQMATTPWIAPTQDWQLVQGQMITLQAGSTLDFQIICSGSVPRTELWVDDVEVNLMGSEPEIENPGKLQAQPGQPLEFVVTARDPSGEPIRSFTADLSDLPMLNDATFTVDPGTARGVLHWTPQPEDGNWSYRVNFKATSILDKIHTTEIDVIPPASNPSLVPNPSFESPLVNGWRGYQGAVFERVSGGRSSDWALSVHEPDSTAEYGINDSPNWIGTTPAAGIPFRFACWVRGVQGTGRALLRVREFLGRNQIGATTHSVELPLSPAWRPIGVDRVTAAAGSTLDLQVLCEPDAAGTTFDVDDVSIRPLVAVPGALASGSRTPVNLAFERPTVFPNPVRGHAMLGLELARPGPLTIALYDLNGRRVRTVFAGSKVDMGTHEFELDGLDDHGHRLGPGVFFYRIQTPSGIQHGRFMILE